jgi:hypothetical protein
MRKRRVSIFSVAERGLFDELTDQFEWSTCVCGPGSP